MSTPRSVCVRVSIFAAPVFIDVTADNGPETGQTWTLQKQTGKWNVVFVKFICWVVAYHVIALNYWSATGHISITFFFFFYSNWVISPSSLVESCSLWKNKPFNWEYNLFFSLRQRKTVNGLWNRVDTCLRRKRLGIYKNNKEKKLKWIIIFLYLVYCCDFAFTTVLEQVDQEQTRGMKGEEFFLFSFFF